MKRKLLLAAIAALMLLSVGCNKDNEEENINGEQDTTETNVTDENGGYVDQVEVVEVFEEPFEPDTKEYLYSRLKKYNAKAPKTYSTYVEEFENLASYFLEAFDNKGKKTWRIEWADLAPSKTHLASRPAISKNKFFIEVEGHLQARDLKTGTFLWEFENIGKTERLVVKDKVLYFYGYEGTFFMGVDTETGEPLWRYDEKVGCEAPYWIEFDEETFTLYCKVDSDAIKKFDNIEDELLESSTDNLIPKASSESESKSESKSNEENKVRNKTKSSEVEKIAIPKNDIEESVKDTAYTGCVFNYDGSFKQYSVKKPFIPKEHIWGQAKASTILSNREGDYEPSNIIDGSTETGWSEGAKGYGEDEWIEFKSKVPYLVSELIIYNGYHKSEEDYKKNGKLKKVEITLGNADSIRYSFEETERVKEGLSEVNIKLLNPVEIKFINLTIMDAGGSELYKNTFISEIETK